METAMGYHNHPYTEGNDNMQGHPLVLYPPFKVNSSYFTNVLLVIGFEKNSYVLYVMARNKAW